jgi:hypothetical protein
MQNSGVSCRENAVSCSLSAVIAPLHAGHRVRRGLLAQTQPSLQYRIARSSRAKAGGRATRSPKAKHGAARGTRTPDPVITNDVLYQLSYCGGAPANSSKTRAPLISAAGRIGKENGALSAHDLIGKPVPTLPDHAFDGSIARPSGPGNRASRRPAPWACRFVPQIRRLAPRHRCRDHRGRGRSGSPEVARRRAC